LVSVPFGDSRLGWDLKKQTQLGVDAAAGMFLKNEPNLWVGEDAEKWRRVAILRFEPD